MKTILVVCGSGIATSTAAVEELKEKLSERGIKCNIEQCDVFSVPKIVELSKIDVIAYTCSMKETFGVPAVSAVSLLTGVNEDKTIEQIVSYL